MIVSGSAKGGQHENYIEAEPFNLKIRSNIMQSTPISKQAAAEKRKAEALEIFKTYPNAVSIELQAKILAQQVDIGMDPYMAHLAAGAFAFKVDADPAKWEGNADPYNVMWAQSQHPDDSQIWMTFETDTQFPGEGEKRFTVYFQKGKAVKIEKLAGGK